MQTEYNRAFKLDCLKEILSEYRTILNVPNYPEDVQLLFMLTVCRMIDRGAAAATATSQPPLINFTAIQANQTRLFRRYRFDARADETANIEAFVDALLDAPHDSTARFL